MRERFFEGKLLLAESFAITDRGDRIRTCDLVLPKHPPSNLRQWVK